jgi:hypothetical protein
MLGIEHSRATDLKSRHKILELKRNNDWDRVQSCDRVESKTPNSPKSCFTILNWIRCSYMYKSVKDFTCTLYKYPKFVQIKGHRD